MAVSMTMTMAVSMTMAMRMWMFFTKRKTYMKTSGPRVGLRQ